MWFVVFFFLKKKNVHNSRLRSGFDNVMKYNRLHVSSVQYSEFITVYKIASNSSADESAEWPRGRVRSRESEEEYEFKSKE